MATGVASASADALSRRRFVALSALAGAGAALAAVPGAAAPPDPGSSEAPAAHVRRAGRARNIIFMVSDGMSTGTLTLADMAIAHRHGRRSWWCRAWEMPGARRASVRTHAADSLVTDSAAGGSAWGIGRKVANGAVNMFPDGSIATPIQVQAKAAGMRIGLVSTTRITDATPASFIANVRERSQEQVVAAQLLERRVDLLLGGGSVYFPKQLLDEHRDLTIARNVEELSAAAAKEGRLLGLFAKGSMRFELDRDAATTPSLAAMTQCALDRLSDAAEADSTGFLLQIEGGRIDHAAHGNDAASLVADQIAFDDALGIALAFARERDDTLVIVTTDHANANPGLTLYGSTGNQAFERLLGARHSFEWIQERLGGMVDVRESAESLPALVREATGIELAADEAAWVRRKMVERARINGFAPADAPEAALAAVLANSNGVAFMSTNHTSDLVDAVAVGPGAELLKPLIDNTELHGVMVAALGL